MTSALLLMLFASCTASTPTPSYSPIVMRTFSMSNKSVDGILAAFELYGISCGVEGGMGAQAYCSATEQQWREAEATVARLTTDGVMKEITGNGN
jgi:hypothetical protein